MPNFTSLISIRSLICVFLTCSVTLLNVGQAYAVSLVRDVETEELIRSYTAPIFTAAGLSTSAVSVHLISDNSINAFVAGGQQLFINTGLITELDSPNQVQGVIAHEAGHIAGAHLSRTREALSKSTPIYIASLLLGAAAAVAGSGEAAAGIFSGGQHVVQRNFLAYSRTQEASADQAGATYLEQLGLSGRGMLETFDRFRDQEVLSGNSQDPYVRSHPLSSDRLAALQRRVEESPYYEMEPTAAQFDQYNRVQAKLHAFIDRPRATFNRYPDKDQSLPARYARAIANYRYGRADIAVEQIDDLLSDFPNDPFFNELKGQVLFENGRTEESIGPYRAALTSRPVEPQFQLALGRAMLATENSEYVDEAVTLLRNATQADPQLGSAWQQLAIGYARQDNIAMAELASANQYLVRGDKQAAFHARRAMKLLPPGSPAWLRAQDITAVFDKQQQNQ